MVFKKINKKLKLSARRVRNFYSNVIAGIIAGGFVGTILTIVQKYSEITWKIPSVLQIVVILIMFFLLYIFGKRSIVKMTKNPDELEGYNSNIQAGFFASIFTTILLSFQDIKIRMYLILPITIVFVFIIWLIAGRKR